MNIKERSLLSEDESEIYCNLNRLMPEGVVVFVKVKLSEFLTPIAEYGTELFYQDFLELNNLTAPFLLFDVKNRKVEKVITFHNDSKKQTTGELRKILEICQIPLIEVGSIAELYTLTLFENKED
ncbi:DUF2726 domain-containing protein (plasmid) [Arsenophonus nasoniae]|uniref:DUF2726 domain-containing protein n=2 Tax=Arsenophonus nasoniae TaxID=638 RepID=A0A4P7LA39_9GAMM|nr:DUF2726 domain-containing protein [Arsenophonus nasoniae]QBY46688.1 hypothetical protein ArsFIN_52990 [Arsenophonus nasoniae]QBY46753.1 hypothetical protein ArsFIN_53640 [Arsenophonus nasoniae]WGM08809.1 DUF2726 domain-containing protein [Arsenophonus nasoniae]WGM13510.1 DUF2726 domain-containing protein [Arsenophonus nasoniae]WGM18111.1 DUF2726 domain-containing protein [Arsenophonus nasoniae]